jgi:sigma-E factor negative regulatory protein RseC
MTNEGIVTKLLPNGMAEVAVTRATACGGSCSSCEGCMYQTEMTAAAKNLVNAMPGQRVVIESRTSVIFNAALLVYIMPLVLFIAGYAIAYLLGGSENTCIGVSFGMLIVSAAILVISQKHKKNKSVDFNIIEICEGGQDD